MSGVYVVVAALSVLFAIRAGFTLKERFEVDSDAGWDRLLLAALWAGVASSNLGFALGAATA